jgi:hypothetical protein
LTTKPPAARLLEVRLEKQIVSASGPRLVEHSQRVAMARRWFSEDHPTSAHLWEEDRAVVAWLETQLEPETRCTVQDSIKLIRKETLLTGMKEVTSELAEDLIMYLAEKLSLSKRAELVGNITELGEVKAPADTCLPDSITCPPAHPLLPHLATCSPAGGEGEVAERLACPRLGRGVALALGFALLALCRLVIL